MYAYHVHQRNYLLLLLLLLIVFQKGTEQEEKQAQGSLWLGGVQPELAGEGLQKEVLHVTGATVLTKFIWQV